MMIVRAADRLQSTTNPWLRRRGAMRSTRLPRACAVSGHDLQAYQASDDFRSRAQRTRVDYVKQIKIIEAEYGDFPYRRSLIAARARSSWHGEIGLRCEPPPPVVFRGTHL